MLYKRKKENKHIHIVSKLLNRFQVINIKLSFYSLAGTRWRGRNPACCQGSHNARTGYSHQRPRRRTPHKFVASIGERGMGPERVNPKNWSRDIAREVQSEQDLDGDLDT